MGKIKFGVLSPSDIAYRKFLPALTQINGAEFVGLAVNSLQERYGDDFPAPEIQKEMLQRQKIKAQNFLKSYGGKIFSSYEELASSREIDALYIPLPPAMHYKFAKIALHSGKHVLLEKPSTLSPKDTGELIEIAEKNSLALQENYMFVYHAQLKAIREIINSGEIGSIRLLKLAFGFPMRKTNDFRYVKKLGGGALYDAGGYTIKLASNFLGQSAKILYGRMNYLDNFEVDMYGSGALCNDENMTAQISFGMDNDYKCSLEIWGSLGTLTTGRIFTAPAEFVPEVIISKNGSEKIIKLPSDDAFMKSIKKFIACIHDEKERRENYSAILKQSQLVEDFRRKAHE